MTADNSFESPNGRSEHHQWEPGYTGALEDEWRQVLAMHASPEAVPEWKNPQARLPENRLLPLENRESQIAGVRQLIQHCKRIALPVTLKILAGHGGTSVSRGGVQQLLAEYEHLLNAAESETSLLEAQMLGESEFNAELQSTEQAQDLALSEVLAAEAAHAQSESEAQALLGTALPISISIVGGTPALTQAMPAFIHQNAKLVSALFNAGGASREALGLLPTIQRRVAAAIRHNQDRSNSGREALKRLFAAQTAKVLASPSIIGRALIRNQIIRSHTMPACPSGHTYSPGY